MKIGCPRPVVVAPDKFYLKVAKKTIRNISSDALEVAMEISPLDLAVLRSSKVDL